MYSSCSFHFQGKRCLVLIPRRTPLLLDCIIANLLKMSGWIMKPLYSPLLFDPSRSPLCSWMGHDLICSCDFRGVLLQINVNSKKVDVFTLGQEFQDGTYEIFDIWNKKMVISYETPTQLPQYYVIEGDNKTPLQHDAPEGEWIPQLSLCLVICTRSHSAHGITEVEKLLEGQQWKFIDVQSTQDSGKCEAILISPPGEGPAPMIAYPHGGPHSNTPSMFVGLFGYFVSLGYHVLLVNYRGSLGFGQDELEGLCGRSGFRDVQDVKDAIEEACKLVRLI